MGRYGGNNYRLKNVRPIGQPAFAFRPWLTPFSISSLEEALLKALPSLFPNFPGAVSDTRVEFYREFYDKFQREADEYDRDFMRKYDEDLNTTLIFVSVFSATPPRSWR